MAYYRMTIAILWRGQYIIAHGAALASACGRPFNVAICCGRMAHRCAAQRWQLSVTIIGPRVASACQPALSASGVLLWQLTTT